MTVFVPEIPALLHAVVDSLEKDLLTTSTGYAQFQTRICINVLRIVLREVEQGDALQSEEWARLSELLGSQEPLAVLNQQLIGGLEEGSIPLDTQGLVPHLRATLAAALEINHPGWTSPAG